MQWCPLDPPLYGEPLSNYLLTRIECSLLDKGGGGRGGKVTGDFQNRKDFYWVPLYETIMFLHIHQIPVTLVMLS